MATYSRGCNPIWFEVDLDANPFDDTFYLLVLQNEFPYLPATVWHNADGTDPWNNPIQFLGNGTLPIDIYFDDDVLYRLEFRKGPTQSDPLIYVVPDYTPGAGAGGGGSGPIGAVAIVSDNQITNPQFSLINFSSPLAITSGSTQTIDVAPGWFLDLTGSGNVTLTQVPLNDSAATINPTNAPYALQITTSGTWTNVVLRQRFQQNGMLWANKNVSNSITARIEGAPQFIEAQLVDSNGTTLAEVLSPVELDGTFNEYIGYGTIGESTNPDLPPAAYIDYQLILPTAVDIYLTSIQLVAENVQARIPFTQDSIDRQIDYTWHYYRNSVLTQPKESLLSGWDFGLNPWQFRSTSSSTVTQQCTYTADQTIVYQQSGGSNVAVGQGTAAENYAFEVKAVTTANQFALIQYIDSSTVRDVWGSILSSLVRAYISSPTHDSSIRFKMRLIYRSSAPNTIGAAEPISSWTGSGDPTFSAGWTAIAPKNDPIYTFGENGEYFTFEGMQLPAASSDTMYLGVVLYTLDPMDSTATADRILFQRVSLCRNDFAIDGQLLTFTETLERCSFYYESTKNFGLIPTQSSAAGAILQNVSLTQSGPNITCHPLSFFLDYNYPKRNSTRTSVFTPSGTMNQVSIYIRQNGAQLTTADISFSLGWVEANGGNKGLDYLSDTSLAILTHAGVITAATEGYILFHYEADSRLGV